MARDELKFELISNVEEIKDHTRETILKALVEVGNDAVNYVTELVPVDTGLLRNSMTYAVAGHSPFLTTYRSDLNDDGTYKSDVIGIYNGTIGDESEQAVYVGSNVEYAEAVEFREAKHPNGGQAHFLRDGISNNLEDFKRILREVLSEE